MVQAQTGLPTSGDMEALKHNFFLRGTSRSVARRSGELAECMIACRKQHHQGVHLSAKQLFDKQDSAKLKNQNR